MRFRKTLKSLFDEFSVELYCLRETGDLDDELFQAAFEYLCDSGEMPYGVAKGRTGDPYEFVTQFLMDGFTKNTSNV